MTREPEGARRTRRDRGSAWRLAVLAAVACCALLGCAEAASGEGPTGTAERSGPAETGPAAYGIAADNPTVESTGEAVTGPETGKAEGAAETRAAPPQRVRIPSIDLDESQLVDLRIRPDGRLEEPEEWDDVGWFADGSMPGEAGPTVIAGHVDSRTGPAVFYRVLELAPGDEVALTDDDGEEHLYRVEQTADFPKDDFPTREVFGAQLSDELRLITCTGEFDVSAGRHLDNRVVFASRIE